MKFCVYTIHNIKNNKIYVGETNNLKRRWLVHQSLTKRHSQQYIHRAIRKYGLSSFILSVIQKFAHEKDCNDAEIYWIDYFSSFDSKFGYNLTLGGDGSSGRNHTLETKQKISQMKKGTFTGENTSNSKLSEQQVLDIITLYTQKQYIQRQISVIYNISQQQVSRIVNRKRWSHLIVGNQ